MSESAPMIGDEAIFFERVRRSLAQRIGVDLRITIDALARECGFESKRKCEEFLQLHWQDFPFCLVNLDGIFQPDAAAQINHYLAANRSRIRNVAIRNRSTIRAALRAGWKRDGKRFLDRPRQAELFEEKKQKPQGVRT
jgi:hypothetical protein